MTQQGGPAGINRILVSKLRLCLNHTKYARSQRIGGDNIAR